MVNVITDNSDISYTNSYWTNNVMSSQNENRNEEKQLDEYEIYVEELESLTKQEDRQRHGKRYGNSRYSEYRPHKDIDQNYREFSTNYKKFYNQQKESFVKPYYSKCYTNDSRLDKILARDRGTDILSRNRGSDIIIKSCSRNNL